ncbi:response regulator [Maribrevibacterium harenarium]|uniref:histidine kinase n=1 Tax=Maribrevibacterium harenarium TaxID=2589817 RepID=A0A501WPA3_9GAMM|nr:ATP-binding protein [Maribrevibacterium harenarium]TPE51269.1 response regulator [Maribrevibacterium harenarium]
MIDNLFSPFSPIASHDGNTVVFFSVLAFLLGYCVNYAAFRELDLARNNNGAVKQTRHILRSAISLPLGIMAVLILSFFAQVPGQSSTIDLGVIGIWYLVAVTVTFTAFKLFNGGCETIFDRSLTGVAVGLLVASGHVILHENTIPHNGAHEASLAHFFYSALTVLLLVLGFNACNLMSRLARSPGLLFYSHFTKPMMVTLCILVTQILPIEVSSTNPVPADNEQSKGLIIVALMLTATLWSFYLLASGFYATFIKRKWNDPQFHADEVDTRPLFWQSLVTTQAAVFLIISIVVAAQWGYLLSKQISINEVQINNARTVIGTELTDIYNDIDKVFLGFDFQEILENSEKISTKTRFRDYVGGFVQASGRYHYISVLDQSSLEVARMEYNNGFPALAYRSQLNDRDFSLEVIQGMTLETGQYFISPVSLSRRFGHLVQPLQPVLKISAPIVDSTTGVTVGVVVFAYRFEQLAHLLNVTNSGIGNLSVLSEFNRVLIDLERSNDWGYLRDVGNFEFIDTAHFMDVTQDVTTFHSQNEITTFARELKSTEDNVVSQQIPEWKILVQSNYPWAPFYQWNIYLFVTLFFIGFSVAQVMSRGIGTLLQHERQIDDLLIEIGYQKQALDEHAIVSVADVRGNIIYANDKFCEISGYQRDELIGQNHRLLRSEEHPHEFFKTMWKTIANGQVWTGEIKNLRKDHSAYWVRATILPILNRQGKPERYIAVRTDITASKVIANVLEDSLRDAHQAAEAKNRFLANISHEIRTPMNAIIGLTDACLAVDNKANQRELIQKVNISANNLLRIINDILDFSKMESGKLDIEQTSFSLQDVIEQYAYVHYNQAVKKQVELLIGVDSKVQDNLIGDPLRIGQVISNLVSNAIKFTQHGEVMFYVKHLQTVGDAVELEFSVRDSGIGMSPEQVKRLFTPFTQADISTTRKFGGTGLGLSICKSLVSLMGGDIKVESTLGEGTVFSFTLFVKCDTNAPTLLSPKVQSVLNERNTLVIECHAVRQQNYVRYLTAFGTRFDVAINVDEAKSKLTAKGVTYDYILVDCHTAQADPSRFFELVAQAPTCTQLRHIFFVDQDHVNRSLPEAWQERVTLLDRPVTQSVLLESYLAQEQLENKQSDNEAEQEAQKSSVAGLRLLIAEDNEINQLVLSEILKLWELEYHFANNGEEAVAMVQELRPDVVLMDVQMPVMDGYEATKAIRSLGGYFADLPIIAVTANNSNQDIKRARQTGMNGHVAKPISRVQLHEVLSRYGNNQDNLSLDAVIEETSADDGLNTLAQQLPELHMKEAIQRLGVDEDFYKQVLMSFADGIDVHRNNLQKAINNDDNSAVVAVTHTIKGLSGTLGAQHISSLAAKAERAAKEGHIDLELLAEMTSAITVLGDKINLLLAPNVSNTHATGDALSKHTLKLADCKALFDLVESYDTKANSLAFEYMEQQQNTDISEDLKEIYDLLSNYDYERASEELTILMERISE